MAGVVAQFNASQLITQREMVSLQIKSKLTERARDFHLILDDVSIVDLMFGDEYRFFFSPFFLFFSFVLFCFLFLFLFCVVDSDIVMNIEPLLSPNKLRNRKLNELVMLLRKLDKISSKLLSRFVFFFFLNLSFSCCCFWS